ncbi:metal-dependent hydrolase family protein [Pseudalkalibacillus salsuginis]|uniref:metal-dependent hydrolase family protein n=1 Tax=Pseudalkalibacillus salsuginis TaxID=2910972 RepID=UPI001F193F61|nr:amidohydrolase family protein [Pseudalkalibacillus salsuginis]MCF6411381.1 amidohydrolase family protein [Pseudalkalibacillus salsuginis]
MIIAIGHEANGIDVDQVIDGEGLTCLPGLMDCHVHLTMDGNPDPFRDMSGDSEADGSFLAVRNARKQLDAGVTSVRNLGSQYNIDIALRNAIEKGMIEGPCVIASGKPIVMTGGHAHNMAIEADGVDEVRKAARTQLKAGADLLKLMATGGIITPGVDPGATQLDEDELRCACSEASKAGKMTAAHAQGREGIKNAIRAGITTVEHGIYLDEELIGMMLESGTYLVPTLSAPFNIAENGLDGDIPQHAIEKTKIVMDDHKNSFIQAYMAGVKIAAGTDAGTPFNFHGKFPKELELMVGYGMGELDALRSATVIAAEAMSLLDKTGSVEVGKTADLLLVEGNPLENISDVRNVAYVFKEGKCVTAKREKSPYKV